MDIYHYSKTNGEFLGAGTAKPDPMRPGNFLIPANATTEQPVSPGNNQAAVFSGGAWGLVADYRGGVWYEGDGTEQKITELGQSPDPAWLSEKPVLPEPIPQTVSMRQARLALFQSGYLADVESAVSGMSQDAQIEWGYASTVERSGALTQVMIGVLSLTEAQTDDLFTLAATL